MKNLSFDNWFCTDMVIELNSKEKPGYIQLYALLYLVFPDKVWSHQEYLFTSWSQTKCTSCKLSLPAYEPEPGMVGLAPKWVRLAPNGTNPGKPTIPDLNVLTRKSNPSKWQGH